MGVVCVCVCADVTTICKLSTLEYKYGDQERGRTLFESLVSAYPRKVDVWLVYVDTVTATKDFQAVRSEREGNISKWVWLNG